MMLNDRDYRGRNIAMVTQYVRAGDGAWTKYLITAQQQGRLQVGIHTANVP